MRVRVETGAELEPTGSIRQSVEDFLINAAFHVNPRASHADLSGVGEYRVGGSGNRPSQVGIVEDQYRRLAAELQRKSLEVAARIREQLLADLGGTGERDLVYLRVAGEVLPELAAWTRQDAYHALRHPRLQQQPAQVERRQRRQFRGFENATAAGGERRRQLPGSHHQRPVPGNDLCSNADRLIADQPVKALPRHRGIECGAGQLGAPAGVVTEGFGGVRHFTVQGGGVELPAVQRLQLGQRPCVAFDQLRHAQEHALLVRRRLSAPAPVEKRRLRGCYGIVRLFRGRRRDACDLPVFRGIDDRLRFAACPGQRAPAHERTLLRGQKVQRRLRNLVGDAHGEAVMIEGADALFPGFDQSFGSQFIILRRLAPTASMG